MISRWLSAPLLLAAALLSTPVVSEAQSWRTVSASRQRSGEEELDVRLTYGAGRFKVRPAEDSGLLYRMLLRYDEERFDPRTEYDDGRLRIEVEGRDQGLRLGSHEAGELTLTLARDVPMELDLRFGAVQADIDLGGLSLRSLELRTGASESSVDVSRPNPFSMERAVLEVGAADFTARRLGNLNAERIRISAGVGSLTLDLTGLWARDGEVDIEMGLGALELRLPEGLGVRLEKKAFLTAFDSERLVERDGAWYSRNWEEAERRVRIDLKTAFGSIDVVWVR